MPQATKFKAFPKFSELAIKDRDHYERLISEYPPVSDIAFASLMTWWDYLGGVKVALLNGNIVISYWMPGDEDFSGLALIGTSHVDESICAIFDYQREHGEQPKLVNVPEFVVHNMRYPEMFRFKTGLGDDEYLLSLSRFSEIGKLPPYMRIPARRFIRMHEGKGIEVRPINMDSLRCRQLLLEVDAIWPLKGINNINKIEREVLPVAVNQAPELGIFCVGLYIGGQLEAYCLYFKTNDDDHAVIAHARVNYEIPKIFDYIVYAFSKYLQEKGFKYLNVHSDNGSQKMRALKLALRPEGYFRKYTIEPS